MSTPSKLYHLTRERNLPSILDRGLVPSKGPGGFSEAEHSKGVYMWLPQDIDKSGFFVDESGWILLEISLPEGWPVKIKPEAYPGEYSYVSARRIPPKFIKVLGSPREFIDVQAGKPIRLEER